jgi:hypothetical protein
MAAPAIPLGGRVPSLRGRGGAPSRIRGGVPALPQAVHGSADGGIRRAVPRLQVPALQVVRPLSARGRARPARAGLRPGRFRVVAASDDDEPARPHCNGPNVARIAPGSRRSGGHRSRGRLRHSGGSRRAGSLWPDHPHRGCSPLDGPAGNPAGPSPQTGGVAPLPARWCSSSGSRTRSPRPWRAGCREMQPADGRRGRTRATWAREGSCGARATRATCA